LPPGASTTREILAAKGGTMRKVIR